MKRSEINAIIRDFEELLAENSFVLPPFLSFTPEEWQEKGHEYDEVRDNALGWDVTDYGEGDFFTEIPASRSPGREACSSPRPPALRNRPYEVINLTHHSPYLTQEHQL